MADATRARGPTSKPVRGGYARKAKATASSSSGAKNQQSSSPYSASVATVLPRIDRRGVDLPVPKSEAVVSPRPIASPQERDLSSVPISMPIPPRRPSSKETAAISVENSPTYHGDDLDGPSARAAWCTPRSPTPTEADQPHLTAFFASTGTNDANESTSDVLAAPPRLKSVEEALAATGALYSVDLEQLEADNDKFLEIASAAHQHVEVMQSELPSLADSFQSTRDALSGLCGDIATLHQQHEEAQQRMMEQLTSTVDSNADEMVALTDAHAADKAQLTDKHLQEMKDVSAYFQEKLEALEHKLSDTEASYQEQIDQLRASSKAELERLQALTAAELASAKDAAQEELEALKKLSKLKFEALQMSSREELQRRERETKEQLEALRASSSAQYENLRSTSTTTYETMKTRLETEITDLTRHSQEELAAVRSTLTSQLETLQRDSDAEIAALKTKAANDLASLGREKEEEVERVRSTLTAECTRLSNKADEEETRLNKLREEQLSQLEERRVLETSALATELHQARTTHSKDVNDLHTQYKTRISSMEETYATETAETKAVYVAQLNDLVRKSETKLSETVARYEDKLQSTSEAHESEMKRTSQQAAVDCESLVTKYERQAVEAEEERRREREALVLGYETDLEALKRSTREQLDQSAKTYEVYVSQLRESHTAKVLSLEASLRDSETQFNEQLAAQTAALEQCETRLRGLEASREALRVEFQTFSERSSQEIARKEMDTAQQESIVLLLDQELRRTQSLLEDTQRKLKFAEDDRQVKAGTILELTFVIKSRDDEVDKLRNSLLDSVQTVNSKTEILEMTAETLSSKARELEATRAALRLESGRLTMVEESMHHKEGMLEDTTLKVESMRLSMDTMRLEMKRLQMDMKLQLEHTEGEMELKNGEIRRLHGSVNELKLKNDFSQQTIERLEETLSITARQVDEAQRRVNLLKLEANNSKEELTKTSDALNDKDRELLVACQDKQAVSSERSRLQIQVNNLTVLSQRLREEAHGYAMTTEETHTKYQCAMDKLIKDKDERLGAEKHLLTLELKASKDMVNYLEGVEERYKRSTEELEAYKTQRTALNLELGGLRDSVTRLEDELQACQIKVRDQESTVVELRDAAEVSETRYATLLETERRRVCDLHTEVERLSEELRQVVASSLELDREKQQLQDDLGRAKSDHAFLLESINEEKTGIFETIAGLKKELGDCEQELKEAQRQRMELQDASTCTQTELEQAVEQLEKTRKELTDRCDESERLSDKVKALDATCANIKAKRDEELVAHADVCRQYDAASAVKDAELEATAFKLKESLEKANMQREDSLSSIRETVEKAETAVKAVEVRLKRMEEEQLQLQQAHDDTVRQLEDGKTQKLEQVQAEKNEAMRLAEEDRLELVRLNNEEKLAILRQAEEEKRELLLERQLRETATRNHRVQERERLRRLAKYEQERLMELNEVAQMLSEEQTTRLLGELHRTKDENATLMVEYCLTDAAAKLQLVLEQEELRKLAHDERIRLLELNEASRMVAEEQRARFLNKEQERQLLMDEEHAQMTIAQQRERFSEQHERFVMWNAEYEARVLASHLADVEALQDEHTEEKNKLEEELADVKRALDERAAKAEADRLEYESAQSRKLLTTAERHQVELKTSMKVVEGISQALEEKTAELAAARWQLEDQSQAMRQLEESMTAKRLDTEAHLNANLLELEVHHDTKQQELEIELSATEIALSEANEVITAKTAAIESLRAELAIVQGTSEGTRLAAQLVAVLQQQAAAHLLEHHCSDSTEMLEGEQGLLECVTAYYAMRCRPGASNDSASSVLYSVDDVLQHLQDYDRVSSLLRGEAAACNTLKESSNDSVSNAVEELQRSLERLRASIHELSTGASDGGNTAPTNVDTLTSFVGSLRGFIDKLQLASLTDSERVSRLEEVAHVVEQHERLMQAVSISSERDQVHSVDDICTHFDKLEKMLTRARHVTENDGFKCLNDLERILDECELHRRQVEPESDLAEVSSGQATASELHDLEMFVSDCCSVLELVGQPSIDAPAATVAVLQAIRELMSVLHHFETLQPQLGSPRRRNGDDCEALSSPEKPPLHHKVAAIVAFVDELKGMSEFAHGILDEENDPVIDLSSQEGSNLSSSSLESLRSLTRTPTLTMELTHAEVHTDSSSYLVDGLELRVDATGDEGSDLEPFPALSAPPSAFMADSLLDISLVMSDHQRLLADTLHLVDKVSRQDGEPKKPLDVGQEISRLVREHCALLALTKRLFNVRDARQDLPSLLECVAILQRYTQRLPLLGSQPDPGSNSNSSASLQGEPQAQGWGHGLLHSSSSFGGGHNDASSTASLASSDQVVRPSQSIFATIEEVARHLQDYDYLVKHLEKKHKAELPSEAFTSVETLANVLSANIDALAQVQAVLRLENAVNDVPQLSNAVHDVVQHTRHLVLEPTTLSTTTEGVEAIQRQFEAVVATLSEFLALFTWMKHTILQIPATTTNFAVEPVDLASIHGLKQHVRDFVGQLCDLQTANKALEEDLAAMQQAQKQMLHELRSESEILSRLDSTRTETAQTEETSPQRRRADVLETLLARQEALKRQSSFQDREQQREAAFLRDQGLLASDTGAESTLSVSSTTRLAVYKRLIEDRSSLERQLEQLKTELVTATGRMEAEKMEFHRQAELARQHDRDATAQETATLKQTHETEIDRLKVEFEAMEKRFQADKRELEQQIGALKQTEAQFEAEKQELELRTTALTQQQLDWEAQFTEEKTAMETQVITLQQSLADTLHTAEADRNSLEKRLNDWKHLAQAALDEEMAYLRRSDSLAFAASKLQCFSDGSISDRDVERGYSRLNVWKVIVAHIDRLSDRLAAVEHRDAQELELLQSCGLVEVETSDVASMRSRLFQELVGLRTRERELQRELEEEAEFVHTQAKMEFDASQALVSRQRVYQTLVDGQNALIEDKMEQELEAEAETALLEANNLQFDSRMLAFEHLVVVCKELELLKTQVDEERDLLVQQRVCTPQELQRPLQSRGTDQEAEQVDSGEATSLGEFASIRMDVYRKLLANEQRARDDVVEREADWVKQLQDQQQVHQATVESLELAVMLREDFISALPGHLEKLQADLKAQQRQEFDEEKRKEMEDALTRWSEQSEAAIAAATTSATANAAALVQETHEQELQRLRLECDDRIASLTNTQAKQLATVAAVRVDSEAQAKQQAVEAVARQVAKARAGVLEQLAKRDGAAVATIYRCIRMATDVLNPSTFASASTASVESTQVPPSRHGSSNSSNTSDKIPVAVTHSVVALVKELKALKEHVATSLDQLQVDEDDTASAAAPPLSFSSSFLLGGTIKSTGEASDAGTEADKPWFQGNDHVADAILCAYREVMQYASRQLLARQQAAQDALSQLYTLVLNEEAAAALAASSSHPKAAEELTTQRQERASRLKLEVELAQERTAREDADCQRQLHDVCVRRLLEDQRAMETALSASLEASQLECKQLQTRVEQLEHYQRLAMSSSSGFQSSPNAARLVTPTRGFTSSNSSSTAVPMRPERPRDHPTATVKGGGSIHKEKFVSDLEKETGQRRTTGNPTANGDNGAEIRRRRPFPAGEMDTSSLSLATGTGSTAARGSLQDQELWFQGVRTLHFVSLFVSVFFVPRQAVFRVELLNSDTEQQQTVYVPRADMQQFVAQHARDKRRRVGLGGVGDGQQDEEAALDDPTRRGDVIDALFEHVKVFGAGSSNMLLSFE